MAHFAKVENNLVTEVLVVDQSMIDSGELGDPALWYQTSYNTRGGVYYIPNSNPPTPDPDQSKSFRKNYAGIGYTYDSVLDAFIPPQPYPSWLLNTQTCLWEATVPYPDDGKQYEWNEETQSWDLILIPTE